MANLNASLPKVDAEAVSVTTVVIDEILQRPERRPSSDEKAALVELPDPVMLHRVAVSDREREVVASRLGVWNMIDS